jgi:kumamolisin
MPSTRKRQTIPGSERAAITEAKAAGAVDPKERIQVTVLLRPQALGSASARARTEDLMEMSSQLPENRQYLSREDFAAQHGADPDDLAKIDAFAHEHNLTMVQASIPRRTVKLEGTIADLADAFKANLKKYRSGNKVFRGRTGSLSAPGDISDIVVGVFGFDTRPAARPHYRRLDEMQPQVKAAGAKAAATKKAGAKAAGQKGGGKAGKKKAGGSGGNATPKNAPNGSFTPPEVAKLYNFPAGLDGKGQCIALIELNDFNNQGQATGTGFSVADLKKYFQRLQIPMPQVAAIGVDGGANVPGPDPNADGEVMLDIEVAGAVAPGAKIAVYFAPNTTQGFIDAVNTAVHDTVRRPSVISISWGGPEDGATDQFRNGLDQAFRDAAALGITVCCAAGDDGSSDEQANGRDGRLHADFPSSSPFALACGGTKLLGSGSTINNETVWNEGNDGGAGGGGVSNFFTRPSYQAQSKVPKSPKGKTGRGVPDVAGDADPATGYQVRAGGVNSVIGGTSAVAPLWAGLMALINQRLINLSKKPAGFINPLLYSAPLSLNAFHDIVAGSNDIDGSLGKYKARQGWDACTGLGTPDGAKIMQLLGG